MRQALPTSLRSSNALHSLYLSLFLFSFFISRCCGQSATGISQTFAQCYDECGDALAKGQAVGLTKEACDPKGSFQQQLSICERCLKEKGFDMATEDPDLIQYIDYCDKKSSPTIQLDSFETNEPTSTGDSDRRPFPGAPAITPTNQTSQQQQRQPQASPSGMPCQPFFCNSALENWLVFVKYRDIFDSDMGCHNISNRGEMHVLQDCSKIPGCLKVPQNVTDLLNSCTALLAKNETASANGTAATRASDQLAAGQQNKGPSSKKIGSILAAVIIISVAGAAFGAYIVYRKTRGKHLEDAPDLPPPAVSHTKSVRQTLFMPELPGTRISKRFCTEPFNPVEMDSQQQPAEEPPPSLSESPPFVVELEGDRPWEQKRGGVLFIKE